MRSDVDTGHAGEDVRSSTISSVSPFELVRNEVHEKAG